MISHHTAKCGGRRHCGSGIIMLLVAEEQEFTCFRLNLPLRFMYKRHGLKAPGMLYSEVQSSSHALKAAIEENFTNNFCQSVQKQRKEGGK